MARSQVAARVPSPAARASRSASANPSRYTPVDAAWGGPKSGRRGIVEAAPQVGWQPVPLLHRQQPVGHLEREVRELPPPSVLVEEGARLRVPGARRPGSAPAGAGRGSVRRPPCTVRAPGRRRRAAAGPRPRTGAPRRSRSSSCRRRAPAGRRTSGSPAPRPRGRRRPRPASTARRRAPRAPGSPGCTGQRARQLRAWPRWAPRWRRDRRRGSGSSAPG